MVTNFLVWGLLITANVYGAQTTEVKGPLFSYYPTAKNEKISYLGDGCYTTLTQKDQKVFTGPLEYPLIVLSSKYKTMVALKHRGASVSSLADNARTFFGDNLQYINILIYAHVFAFDKQKYEGRTQQEELAFIEQELVKGLQFDAHPQNVKTHIFSDDHLYQHYPVAAEFVVIKQTDEGPDLFHICPITKRLFDTTFDSCSNIPEQIGLLKEKLVQERAYRNPYYKTLEKLGIVRETEEQYGAYSFVKVETIHDSCKSLFPTSQFCYY
jgi:hypothetical protein